MGIMNTTATQSVLNACEIAGGKAALARLIGVSPPTVQQWANGSRPVPLDRCVRIEQVTNGAVTRKDLRPNDWHLIWPELADAGDRIKATDDTQPPISTSSRAKRKAK
jgi:DNA-binding transcriptional regulator YdaS (Cro superfamily)